MGLALACICAGLTILIGVITILVVVIVQRKREKYKGQYGTLGGLGTFYAYGDDTSVLDDDTSVLDDDNQNSKYSHNDSSYKRYKVRTNFHQQQRTNYDQSKQNRLV